MGQQWHSLTNGLVVDSRLATVFSRAFHGATRPTQVSKLLACFNWFNWFDSVLSLLVLPQGDLTPTSGAVHWTFAQYMAPDQPVSPVKPVVYT